MVAQTLCSHLLHQQQGMVFSSTSLLHVMQRDCFIFLLLLLGGVSSSGSFRFAIGVVISVGVPINAQLPWRKSKNEQRFQNKQISNLFGYCSNSCHGTTTFPLVIKIEVSIKGLLHDNHALTSLTLFMLLSFTPIG